MAMTAKLKVLTKELMETARADNVQYVIVLIKDKEGHLQKGDADAEIGMDAGNIMSLVCSLLCSICDNTGVSMKTLFKHLKDLLKKGGGFNGKRPKSVE